MRNVAAAATAAVGGGTYLSISLRLQLDRSRRSICGFRLQHLT